MQYFLYHPSGNRQIVKSPEYAMMLKSGEWFKTPSEAKAAHQKNLEKIKSKSKKKNEA